MSNIILNGLSTDELKEIIIQSLSQVIQKENAVKSINSDEDEFLTRAEVAQLLKITLPTLHDWTKRGIVISYKIGKRVLYRVSEVKEAIHQTKFLKFRKGGASV